MGHDSQCCAFVQHGDGYSLYYPNGNAEAADRANILAVTQFVSFERASFVVNSR